MAELSTTLSRQALRLGAFPVLLLAALATADTTELDGHIKARAIATSFPADSIFRELTGSETLDLESDLRLNLRWREGPWSVEASGQLIALYGERIEFTRELPDDLEALAPRLQDDRRRYFDLTTVLGDSGKTATLARFDRLAVGWTGEKTVVRIGRQALSWGNGLFYAPMDLVNPFDPATIDTEFKAGDDMIYAQRLMDNGDDIQAAIVLRRNPLTGASGSDQATAAVKYHRFAGESEYDFLVAQHFGDPVVGLGAVKSIGGAVWRGDLVLTQTSAKTVANVVTNVNYSWILFDRNMTGGIEYYYNGFGQTGQYDLSGDPELFLRLARGELFTLGRNYLAFNLTVEVTPLWTVSPVLLTNLADPSSLLQVVAQGSLSDNAVLIGTVSVPIGPGGSEFGGIETAVPGRYLSTGPSLFVQYAWYF